MIAPLPAGADTLRYSKAGRKRGSIRYRMSDIIEYIEKNTIKLEG